MQIRLSTGKRFRAFAVLASVPAGSMPSEYSWCMTASAASSWPLTTSHLGDSGSSSSAAASAGLNVAHTCNSPHSAGLLCLPP